MERTRYGSLLWDLAPAAVAPPNDGVVSPRLEPQPWLPWLEKLDLKKEGWSPEQLAELLEAERRRHEQARESAASAQDKASRLLTPCVGLLAAAVAFVSWQLHALAQARTDADIAYLAVAAIPGVVGVGCLMSCILRALDADIRVGIYQGVGAAHLVAKDPLASLEHEHEAAQLAQWTANQKISKIMYARVSLSRALVSLTVSLALAAVALLTQIGSNTDGTSVPTLSPTSTSTHGSQSVVHSPQ